MQTSSGVHYPSKSWYSDWRFSAHWHHNNCSSHIHRLWR